MSKAKKIISMLLAIVMVLSMAPASVLASAANPSYTYVDPVISSSQFTVDTSATTEVIRVAAAIGSFSVSDGTANAPNTIVAATPSGIPENPGTYNYIGYAGETPVQPQVVFSITGKTLDAAPSVVANVDGITFGGATRTVNGSTTTYTIPVQGSSATSLSAGTDIVFTITYKIAGSSYVACAFSHVENILVANGFNNVNHYETTSHTARLSVIGQYQSHNMYSFMNTDGGSAERHAYVNYASEGPLSGGSLLGAGCEAEPSSVVNAYVSAAPNDSISGNEVQAFTKDYFSDDNDVNNHCQGEDQYRGEPVIYMDYGETLQSLNFRFTAQPGEMSDNQGLTLDTFYIYSPGDDPHPGNNDANLAASTCPTNEIAVSTLAAGNTSSATIDVGSANNEELFKKYVMAKFSGIGSATDTSTAADGQHVIYAKVTHSFDGRGLITNTAIGVVFKRYDTRDLRALYNGILSGDGSTFTPVTSGMSGRTLVFNKGPHPRADMFKITGSQWTDFTSAVTAAGSILVKPDTNQTEIDAAALNLYNTYNALSGYNSTVTYNIKHVVSGTTNEIIPMQTGTASAGSTMVSKAATITGYKVAGTSSYTTNISGGEPLVTVTYSYEPENYNLNIYSNNPDVPPKMLSQPYGTEIKVADLETGTRENYQFDGWFYDNTKWQQPVSDFSVTDDISLYGKWSIAPLYVNIIPKTNKGVTLEDNKTAHLVQLLDETTPETFDQPADYAVDGYIFGGYYDDADFTVPAVWPKEFVFGDSSVDVYARMIDVNGVISFNSNGGNTVPDVSYSGASPSTPVDIEAPDAPTKLGYDFMGWYDETGTTQYFADGIQTMTSQTGFVAYAKWEAQEHRITFDMGEPTSKFDTKTSQMPIIVGLTDDPIPADQIPPAPVKYAKTFAQWKYVDPNGQTVIYRFDKMPPYDIVLEPVWNDSNYSAFISLDAYEKLSGEYKELETDSDGNKLAQPGDIVTFRMTSQTNFNVGSTVFAFMYDKNFYELVDSGSSAFVLNRENEYIAGIDAQHIGITSDTAMNSFWPESLESNRATYNAMMVTIDPTVTSTNYYCKPMADGTWLLEFRLRVKDNATGDGTVYMSNEWTRTADNIMGTMFYGWAAPGTDTSVADTNNSVVEPNLDFATQTVTIDTATPIITSSVTVDANGGSWADGDTVKNYEGRAETEIIGYVSPIREGYTLDTAAGWAKDNGDGTLDTSVTWAEGYYGDEDQDGFTFKAQWIADMYTINYYVSETELWETEQLAYDSPIDGPFYPVEKTGYVFDKWVDADGNEYTIGETTVPLGGVDLYAAWAPATDTPYTVTINYFDNQNQVDKTQVKSMTGTTDTTVKVVSEVPATPEAGVSYVLISELPAIAGYEFDADNPNNANISGVITADGKGNINVYYKAKIITYTYKADGGLFSNGTDTMIYTGEFQSTVPTIEQPTKTGSVFASWTPASRPRFTVDTTFTAKWTVAKYDAVFNAGEGATFSDATTTKTVQVAYGSAITAPATPSKTGYDFIGWSVNGTDVVTDLGTMTEAGATFTALFKVASYDVSYTVDGAAFGTSTKADFNSTVTVGAYPTETVLGHTFDGWYYDGNKYAPGDTLSMPATAVTFTGDYVPAEFNAVFDANGGYFDNDETVTSKTVPTVFGDNIVAPAQPQKAGHSFLGWTDTEGSQSVVTVGTMNTEGKTYYAVWKAEIWNYNIELYYMDTNGQYPATPAEGDTSTSQGNVGTTVTYTPVEKTGFAVDTAASTLSGTVTVDPELTIKVYYARNKYTVYTNVNGTRAEAGKFYYDAPVSIPDATPEAGYTFVNWTPAVTSPMPAADQEVTAVFDEIPYTVTFYKDDTKAEVAYTNELDFGTSLAGLVLNPTKEGYTFKGWAYEGTTEVLNLANEKVPVGGVTLVGIWEIESYTVNFRANGGIYKDGSNNKQTSIQYGATVNVPEEPTRVGYAFNGWNPSIPATMPDVDTGVQNYMAQWTQEKYTVNFVIDGVTTSAEYVLNDEVIVPGEDQTVKTGYTFLYWTDENGDEVEPITTMTDLGESGTAITYTAKFEINKYLVTFVSEGTTVESKEYEYEAAVAKPATNPTKTGYTFVAWVDGNGTEYGADNALPAMGDAPVTYTAKFTINSYTVTFVSEGETVESKAYEYEAAVAKPATNPTKTGWTFVAWVADGVEYDENTALPAMGDADVTYTAKFVIDSHKVTWISNGETVETKDYNYGAAVAKPANPVLEGHTFAGWVDNNGVLYGAGIDVPAMGTEDVTYTAKWDIDSHVVTWISEGEKVHEESFEYGSAVTKPEDPTKTGYTFVAWEAADGTRYDKNTAVPAMGTADVTYIAVFEINTYTVTFLETGDTVITPISQQYNSIVVKPADPSQKGYTFKGWATKADATEADVVTLPATWNMPAENVNYYAVWTINQYKVTFLNADGSVYSEELVDYNSRVVAPAGEPTLEFYTFEGWSLTAVPEKLDKETAATYVTDLATTEVLVPVNGITIYPAFARIPVTLKLIAESTAKIENVDTAADPAVGYITGLTTRLNEAKLLSNYLTVEGDGELKVTPTKYNRCGTGTKVEVIDRVTNETVEIYYLVIFGDVNGDSAIDATDAAMIRSESIGLTSWSNTYDNGPDGQYSYAMTRAADVVINEGEFFGIIQDTDAVAIDEVVLMYADIDQTTGKVVY